MKLLLKIIMLLESNQVLVIIKLGAKSRKEEVAMSPTILRIGPYRFFFYSREENRPHIHVEEGNKSAKFWVKPVKLAESFGFSTRELNKLDVLVSENEEHILKEWGEFYG